MHKFKKVAVLGGGAFGVALAKLAAEKSQEVALWVRDEKVLSAINGNRHHPTRLSQVFLPLNITAYSSLETALADAQIAILALPMAALAQVLSRAKTFFVRECIVVSTAKGIEEGNWALPCDVINEHLPKKLGQKACFLSGPSFAIELAMNLPTALTLASLDEASAIYFQEGFSRTHCRLYRTDDVIGVSVGGALKNVIAIAAGACSGLGLGRNALAALITRGLAEITRLAVSMGGRAETLSGLSGAGDLVLSCTDDMSRNHRLGMLLASGLGLDSALSTIGSVVEGVKTAKAIPALIGKYHVELPIARAVYRVLYDGEDVRTAMSSLLARKLKEEVL